MNPETDLPPADLREAREVELKLELEPESFDGLCDHPLFRGRMTAPRESKSIYYDTAKQSLAHAGISLRVRRTGESYIQTIKSDTRTSAGLFDRSELEVSVSGMAPEIGAADPATPDRVRQAVEKGLEPVFESRIERQSCIFDWKEARIELVLDRGEVATGERSEALAEVELELLDGPAEALFDVAHAILPTAPMRIGVLTKAERGTRLASGRASRASKAEELRLTPDMSVGDGFQTVALACIRHFRLNEPLVLLARDADALHQSRVALRRLRSAFSLFKSSLSNPETDRFRSDLRNLAAALGEARNLDVLLKRRGEELSPEICHRLRDARHEAYENVNSALRSTPVQRMMIDLLAWLALRRFEAEAGEADAPVVQFANSVLDRFWKRVKRDAKHLLTVDDERRHELRIAAKKLRYAAEFFASLHETKSRRRGRDRFLSALEKLQDALGDLNDLATGKELQAQLAAQGIQLPSAETSESDQRSRLLVRADEAWLRLAKAGPYWR